MTFECDQDGGRGEGEVLLVIRNMAIYRGAVVVVVADMMHPTMQDKAGPKKWRNLSPVRSACHALSRDTRMAHIHGGAARSKVVVVPNPSA